MVFGYYRKVCEGDDPRKLLTKWVRKYGLRIDQFFSDEPLSAPVGMPGTLHWDSGTLGGLLRMLDTDHFQILIVRSFSELRHPYLNWDPLRWLEGEGGKRVFSFKDSKHSDLRPYASSAHKERISKVNLRLAKGRKISIKRGNFGSGPAPYGYRREYSENKQPQLVPHSVEAFVVKAIFEKYVELGSIGKLANWLNTNGLRTRSGSTWSRQGLSWILKNKVYVGLVRINEARFEGNHESLVDHAKYNQVQWIMELNRKRNR